MTARLTGRESGMTGEDAAGSTDGYQVGALRRKRNHRWERDR